MDSVSYTVDRLDNQLDPVDDHTNHPYKKSDSRARNTRGDL